MNEKRFSQIGISRSKMFAWIKYMVDDDDGFVPRFDDLPAWLDRDILPAAARNVEDQPPIWEGKIADQRFLIRWYVDHSQTKRWAWDGLHRLLVELEDRGEPIPPELAEWAMSVVSRRYRGTLEVPRKINPNNPKFAPQDDRDDRIMDVYRFLRRRGWTQEEALADIEGAMGMGSGTVESIYKKMKKWNVPGTIGPR